MLNRAWNRTIIRSFSTWIESAFFGIMASMASNHRRGQYPDNVATETMTASTSTIVMSSGPAIISEKDGPKVLAAVFTRIFFGIHVSADFSM
jgi:hypothetical protein